MTASTGGIPTVHGREEINAKGVRCPLPWSSGWLSEQLGVPVPAGLHDAMVDAQWALDMLDAVGVEC